MASPDGLVATLDHQACIVIARDPQRMPDDDPFEDALLAVAVADMDPDGGARFEML